MVDIPKMLSQPHNLLDEQRIDYNKGFDLLERSATDIDQRLPVYLSLLKQEETSKLIAIVRVFFFFFLASTIQY